jgi:superfamily II DNA/RNA helicase
VVGPTRELAEQIREALKELAAHTGLHSATIYGGVGVQPQVASLRRGVDIVIACPGRLLDHMRQHTINLSQVECVVLDEADRMFDMGFLPDIRRILRALPAKRQTLLFSATMPDAIRELAHEILRNPVTMQIAHARPAATVTHALFPVPAHLKAPLLLDLLQQTKTGSVLVFTRTKHRAKRLAEQVSRAGHAATCLQGNLSQNRRLEAMAGFRDGRYRVLVATDIAARGIDVSSISHVINFDIPGTVDDYTHRIGRTGRAARTGDAFTLITGEDEDMVRAIERVLGSRIERRRLTGFDYAAQAQPASASHARPHHSGAPARHATASRPPPRSHHGAPRRRPGSGPSRPRPHS